MCFYILIIKLWIDFRLGRCNRSVGQSCCEGYALLGLVAGLVGDGESERSGFVECGAVADCSSGLCAGLCEREGDGAFVGSGLVVAPGGDFGLADGEFAGFECYNLATIDVELGELESDLRGLGVLVSWRSRRVWVDGIDRRRSRLGLVRFAAGAVASDSHHEGECHRECAEIFRAS